MRNGIRKCQVEAVCDINTKPQAVFTCKTALELIRTLRLVHTGGNRNQNHFEKGRVAMFACKSETFRFLWSHSFDSFTLLIPAK